MTSSKMAIIAGASVLAAVSAGCRSSSEAFPYAKPVVWQAAVGRAVVWRPTVDEETMVITSNKTDLGKREILYKCWLKADYNPFARRPSTRVYVSMRQISPTKIRYESEEKEFLRQLGAELRILAGQP